MADELDRARAIRDKLQGLAAAEQKKVDALEGQNAGRNTSLARNAVPDALGRARAARDQFNKAAAGEQKNVDKAAGKEDQGKKPPPQQLQHAPSPGRDYRPAPSPVRHKVDSAAFEARQRNLDRLETLKQAQARADLQKARERDRER